MSGDADIFVENRENVLVLPKEAVTIMEDGLGVVQIKNAEGFPEPLEVSLGVEGDSHVEITGGLSEGDMVLLMNGSMGGGPMPFESPMIAQ
jgi:multidrug efflux pump subunit AcrA (membrane-fusion protein)